MALDIVLFPNCDLHVALHGSPPSLTIRVMSRKLAPDSMSYILEEITSDCEFDYFAPYNTLGNRLQKFAEIDRATGVVTPSALGINLVQVRWVDNSASRAKHHYIIARIQVHDRILGWWFGNTSITTAKDSNFAHAQPSIYALFSDDSSGTDLVGDITGHGYVTLTSGNTSTFTVNADGRLQGLLETFVTDATLNGSFLGTNHSLPVKVVDYAKTRKKLEYVQTPDAEHPEKMHNILFIPEGFRDTGDDREKFNKIVKEVVDEMFNKPRHSPYPLLEGGFNIWKAYEPSRHHGVTCGFRVNDEDVDDVLGKGHPIPYSESVSTDKNIYTVELLVNKVGLPKRNETRSTDQLKDLWGSQTLDDFEPDKVDDDLVRAWKVQKSLGILEARDTFFGLYLGARYGDRESGLSGSSPVLPPAGENVNDGRLAPFVKRVYKWFDIEASRTLTPDPRRHPPELQAGSRTNFGNSILKYINGLQGAFAPHPNVGPEWVPDPSGTTFKKSRGFIAIITNDGMIGGTNFNHSTMTANTLARNGALGFQYTNTGNERVMKRTLPDSINEDIDDIINTIAHEFGHSFNLDDEYEEFPGDNPEATDPGNLDEDLSGDNVASLAFIRLDSDFGTNRKLDPDKIKWFDLLRMRVSDTLIKDSEADGGSIKVTIRQRSAGRWAEAKNQNLEAFLRKPDIEPDGKQLPLKHDNEHSLVRLVIEDVNLTTGAILLGGPELPPAPFPVFPAGSLLFIPKRNPAGQLLFVVERKVLGKLNVTNLPLNRDTDTTRVNNKADYPVDIADFKPPCKSYKLIGVYEGAELYSGMSYRPTGLCKMRKSTDAGTGDGEFCHICKWLIVNRVNPSLHAILDHNHYPEAKKNG